MNKRKKSKLDPFPCGSFHRDLSDVWQTEVIREVRNLTRQLPEFIFGTCASGDTLVVQFARKQDTAAMMEARSQEEDDDEDPDGPLSGEVELRYWRRYIDKIKEIDREMPADRKWEDLLREKGMAIQFEWPTLDICGSVECCVTGPFLNRVTESDLRSQVRKAVLEEMFSNGFICRTGKNGPFKTHTGRRIRSNDDGHSH